MRQRHNINAAALKHAWRASATAVVFWVQSASAQEVPPGTPTTGVPAAADASDGEIIVTGVRGTPRSRLDSPTPVDVLVGEDLNKGRQNLYQELQANVPSFNWSARAGAGTSSGVQTGALRGLNPDQNLVLVNGVRWHHTALLNVGQQLYNGSAPVDLGFIPGSGISRVEVLRDGAAAQYGSDAISGVINMMLKDDPGGSISFQYGQNIDRQDGRLAIIRASASLYHSDAGSLNVFGEAKNQEQSDRSVPIADNIRLFRPLANGQPDPREFTISRLVYHGFGQNPIKQLTLGFNSRYEVGAVELYAFGIFNRRNIEIKNPPIFANNIVALPEVYPDGFDAVSQIRETDVQLALGAKGTLGSWDWNLSTTAGHDDSSQYIYKSINASLGPVSPKDFYVGSLIAKEWTTSLDVTKKLGFENGGSLQISFGLQDRVENYTIKPGEPESYQVGTYIIPAGQLFAGRNPQGGAFYTPGFRPEDSGSWTRNVIAAYGQLAYEPTSRLLIEGAARYEQFNDSSGASWVGKVDGRYKFSDAFVVRGSFGNGFRAPSVAQQHYSAARNAASTAVANLNQQVTTQTVPVSAPAAIALGAVPLRPETSVGGSVGFALTPIPGLNITVDGYQIDVKDRIVLTGVIQGSAVNAILAANGLNPNFAAQYFTNAVDTRTRGLDIIGSYRISAGDLGDFRLTAALNINRTKITRISSTPAALTVLGSAYTLFDRIGQGYLTSAIPTNKLALSQSWKIGRFEVNIQEVHYGKFSVVGGAPANDRTFPAAWIVSPSVRYNFTERVSGVVGADNVFNHYPPATAIFNSGIGYQQYPRTGPYGWTGGSYYARLQVDF